MESIDAKFNKICRGCKAEGEPMVPLFETVEQTEQCSAADMLMACTSLKVSPADGMPREICTRCVEQLRAAYNFKQQCEETDAFFRQFIHQGVVVKTEESDVEQSNRVKQEPPENSVGDGTTPRKRRGRPRKSGNQKSINKELSVILKNIGNETGDGAKYEVSKRGRMRKSVVKYEEADDDDLSDSFDFAEVDASELLDDPTLGQSDPEWAVSDSENVKVKGEIDEDEIGTVKVKRQRDGERRRGRGRGRGRSTGVKQEPYECDQCDMKFRNKVYLKQHEASEHGNEQPFMCEICPQKFARRDSLIEHTRSHLDELNHNCEICGQKVQTVEQLARHKFSKHQAAAPRPTQRRQDKQKHKCDVCGKLFSSIKHRENHIYLAHNKVYYCKTCAMPFRGREAFYLHNTRSNECSKKYLCPDCGARFSATSALKVHIRRHRGEKPFKCQYCEKGFSRKFDLITHETRHRGEKNHLCTICGKGFNRRHMLTIHMRTHTGEKPYKCCYCDAAFTQNNDLKTHIRRHTGERFTCELCDEKFLMHYLLTKHKRIVHGINIPPAKPILERVYQPPPGVDHPLPPVPQQQIHQNLTADLVTALPPPPTQPPPQSLPQ